MAYQWSINKRLSYEDRIASSWFKKFMYAALMDILRATVATKYEKIEDRARGGVTYTYLVLCEMFEVSREVKASMLNFKRRGVLPTTLGRMCW